jgi:predicted  nucleic acid-binding Zn-ribbon protein
LEAVHLRTKIRPGGEGKICGFLRVSVKGIVEEARKSGFKWEWIDGLENGVDALAGVLGATEGARDMTIVWEAIARLVAKLAGPQIPPEKSDLERELEALKSDLVKSREDIGHLTRTVTRLTTDLARNNIARDQELQHVQNEIVRAHEEIARLRQDMAPPQAPQEKSDLERELEALKNDLMAFQERNTRLVDDLSQQTSSIERGLQTVKNDIGKSQEDIDLLSQGKGSLELELRAVKSDLVAFQDEDVRLAGNLTQEKKERKHLEKTLRTEIVAIREDLGGITHAVTQAKSAIGNIEQEIACLAEDLAQGRLEVLESRLDQIQSRANEPVPVHATHPITLPEESEPRIASTRPATPSIGAMIGVEGSRPAKGDEPARNSSKSAPDGSPRIVRKRRPKRKPPSPRKRNTDLECDPSVDPIQAETLIPLKRNVLRKRPDRLARAVTQEKSTMERLEQQIHMLQEGNTQLAADLAQKKSDIERLEQVLHTESRALQKENTRLAADLAQEKTSRKQEGLALKIVFAARLKALERHVYSSQPKANERIISPEASERRIAPKSLEGRQTPYKTRSPGDRQTTGNRDRAGGRELGQPAEATRAGKVVDSKTRKVTVRRQSPSPISPRMLFQRCPCAVVPAFVAFPSSSAVMWARQTAEWKNSYEAGIPTRWMQLQALRQEM